MKRLFYVFLLIVMVLGAFTPAMAQKVAEQYKKPMPDIARIPTDQFAAESTLYSEGTEDNPALAYEIRLPKNWQQSQSAQLGSLSANSTLLGEIGKFYGPPSMDGRSRVEIQANTLEYKMTAEQWMIQFLLSSGYNAQGFKVYDNNTAEAVYVLIEDNLSYIVRGLARFNGKQVLFVQYFMPIERWADEKVLQATVVDSFKLKNKIDEYPEAMEKYEFLDLAALQYPVSWKLYAYPISSIDRMKISLSNVTKIDDGKDGQTRLDGKIDLEMISIYEIESLDKEIAKQEEALKATGLVLGDVIETHDNFILNPDYDFVSTRVFEMSGANSKHKGYEYWMTVISAGDYYYFLTLLTASRDNDYPLWVHNVETYKLIAGLIEPSLNSAATNYEE